jgi:hypothetical protein
VSPGNVIYVLDDNEPGMLRGLERLLKVHGFRRCFSQPNSPLSTMTMAPCACCSTCN